MENSKFVYFKKPGVPFGMAYNVADVAELPADTVERLIDQDCVRPAKPDEIAAAKAAMAKEAEAVAAAKAAQGPSNADLLAEIAALKAQVAAQQKDKK